MAKQMDVFGRSDFVERKRKKKVKRWSGKVSDCIGNRIDGWKIKLTPETAQAIQQSEQVTN